MTITIKSICKDYIQRYEELQEQSNVFDYYWYEEIVGSLIYELNQAYRNYTFVSSGPFGLLAIVWIDAYNDDGTRIGSVALQPVSIDRGEFCYSNNLNSSSNRITGKFLTWDFVPSNAGLPWIFKMMKEFSNECNG